MNFHVKYKRVSRWWQWFTARFEMTAMHSEATPLKGFAYSDEFVELTPRGTLIIKPGFIFDASGPTLDWLPFGIFRRQMKSTRRAVCKHDAFYKMARAGVFNGEKSRYIKITVDRLLRDDIVMDGGLPVRAEIWEEGVEHLGGSSWEG